ncbi:MAG TPA: hypothetical protein VKQ35_16135 [Phenylobacterium sp.]|nr:hypothetical protein [Phenylobacterium sp.]HLZ76537.1 hypothetical protein [Phenylobacterium sp.]
MVNGPVAVELARDPRRGVAILDAQLAARPVAVGVDGSFRHAEFAGDLLRRQVLIDQPQAFAFARREQPHRIFGDDVSCGHSDAS